ncbi:hypothetical protein BJ742DRAFT_397343 [Cladochytrium replicatum]|nr:hypothetical protein BJ742DRAFT_397343 [Cladochytrium replicatum]
MHGKLQHKGTTATDAEEEPAYLGVVQTHVLADGVKVDTSDRVIEPDVVTYTRNEGPPVYRPDSGVETADMLDELLQYIGTQHPDCLLHPGQPLNVPAEIPANRAEKVAEMGRRLQLQIDLENQTHAAFRPPGSKLYTSTTNSSVQGGGMVTHVAENQIKTSPEPHLHGVPQHHPHIVALGHASSLGALPSSRNSRSVGERRHSDARRISEVTPWEVSDTLALSTHNNNNNNRTSLTPMRRQGSSASGCSAAPPHHHGSAVSIAQKQTAPRHSVAASIAAQSVRESEVVKGKEDPNMHLKTYMMVRPPPTQKALPAFQRSRLLLSHLGLLHFDSLKEDFFHLLGKSPALYRDIKGVDKKFGREVLKVAVIYVAHGQEDEQSIFRNEQGSIQYDEFVSSLGWEIDLAQHPGYVGGLERNQVNGSRATYFCNSTLEMIFHDVTKMPTDPLDPKHLKKKRHIGNDHIHIVWNEHIREYRRNTIGGDFGNAQIVITPLTSSLYSIQIHRDQKVATFGPLINRMVVSKPCLGPLVRLTAIHAYRAALAAPSPSPANSTSQQQHAHPNQHVLVASPGTPSVAMVRALGGVLRHPYAQRAADIRTITSRHKVAKWTYEKVIESVFMTTEEGGSGGGVMMKPSGGAIVSAM